MTQSPFRDDLFEGKTAFIAGGTSGINLGIARRYAELGAKVAVLGRNPEKAQAAAESIGDAAIALTADVRDYAAIRAAMEEARDRLGGFDIVVSGAAGNFLAPVLGMSANAFKAVVDIDLLGTFNVFRGCHDLLNLPGASLIAITAGQAEQAMAMQAHACAAKAGINQLVRTLALEWGPDVRVNGISPGPIGDTEGMARLAPDPKTRDAHYARIAMKRWGTVFEIAEAAVYLSSAAGNYVTGAILDVDGGSSIGDASRLDTGKGLA
ncbi:SDR family oxidoreductase [Novosphingobium sp. ZN18A2]|uniref:SDR family oxidoreductase n=1 Tax=Novosphingobium sp. ZN18A2 TaxID=3079861 RepID=UPI0030CDE4C2